MSEEETRTTSSTGGQKGVKNVRLDLIPTESLWELGKLYGFGAQKYDDRNWEKGFEFSKAYAALQRHASLFWMGEDNDEETQLSHMASVAFYALAFMQFMQQKERYEQFDDRPTQKKKPVDYATMDKTTLGYCDRCRIYNTRWPIDVVSRKDGHLEIQHLCFECRRSLEL